MTSMNLLKIRPVFTVWLKLTGLFTLKNSFKTNTTELSPWSGIPGEKLTVSRLVKRTSSNKHGNKPRKKYVM